MQVSDRLDDRQPDPIAGGLRAGHPMEPVAYSLAVGLGNSGPSVSHAEQHPAGVAPHVEIDGAAGQLVLDRVVQRVLVCAGRTFVGPSQTEIDRPGGAPPSYRCKRA